MSYSERESVRDRKQHKPVLPEALRSEIRSLSNHSYKIWDLGSVYLEHKASVARDHLASERTFLAWLRTSLSFLSIGVGITQLFKLSENAESEETTAMRMGRALGLTFISTSMLTLLFGLFRYFMIQRLLIQDIFPLSKLFISFLFIIIFTLIILTTALILVTAS